MSGLVDCKIQQLQKDQLQNGEHHITVPAHDPIKIGTLNAILKDVAAHAGLTRDELLALLFPQLLKMDKQVSDINV